MCSHSFALLKNGDFRTHYGVDCLRFLIGQHRCLLCAALGPWRTQLLVGHWSISSCHWASVAQFQLLSAFFMADSVCWIGGGSHRWQKSLWLAIRLRVHEGKQKTKFKRAWDPNKIIMLDTLLFLAIKLVSRNVFASARQIFLDLSTSGWFVHVLTG